MKRAIIFMMIIAMIFTSNMGKSKLKKTGCGFLQHDAPCSGGSTICCGLFTHCVTAQIQGTASRVCRL